MPAALTGDLAALRFEQVVRLPSPVGVGGVARLLQDRRRSWPRPAGPDSQRPLGADPGLLLRSDAGRLRVARLDGPLCRRAGMPALRLGDWPNAQAREPRRRATPASSSSGASGWTVSAGRSPARASITLRDAVAGSLQLQGRRIDPRFLDPRFAGRVDFRGAVDFDGDGNFRVQLPEASGTLFDRPLRASGHGGAQAQDADLR